jgi:hypothetical protein
MKRPRIKLINGRTVRKLQKYIYKLWSYADFLEREQEKNKLKIDELDEKLFTLSGKVMDLQEKQKNILCRFMKWMDKVNSEDPTKLETDNDDIIQMFLMPD